jgi:hypothetical protein
MLAANDPLIQYFFPVSHQRAPTGEANDAFLLHLTLADATNIPSEFVAC